MRSEGTYEQTHILFLGLRLPGAIWTDPKPANNIFFPAVNWLTSGFLGWSTGPFFKKSEGASNSDTM